LTGTDPTDQALAVIASIFEKPEPKRDAAQDRAEDGPQDGAHAEGDGAATDEAPHADAATDEAATPPQPDAPPHAGDGAHAAAGSHEAPQPAPGSAADLDRYTRYGPGPLDALRFKWSLRLGDVGYFVDETVGATTQPISIGPMSRDDAIALIETRDRTARRRFEELRNEIVMGPSERGYDEDEGQ